MRSGIVALCTLVLAAACGGDKTPPTDVTSVSSATPSATPSATAPVASASASAAPSASVAAVPAPPAPAWRTTGFATPESVLYDDVGDRYLVSNINGKPLEADNNGYISEVSPDGKVTKEKFIAGGVNKVTLNAPKGTAITGGVLYVADLDTVRMFDPKTGAPKGELKIAGATFLNDVAAGPDGKVYVTDTGMKQGAKDFEPSNVDAVYVIEKGKSKVLAKMKELNHPNGILVTDKGILVNTFGSNEVFRLDDKGQKQDVTKTPKGSLDGLVAVGDALFVSSWEGSAVYKGKLGGTFEPAFSNLKTPADIGFDKKRSRILVPLFMDNAVEAYDVK